MFLIVKVEAKLVRMYIYYYSDFVFGRYAMIYHRRFLLNRKCLQNIFFSSERKAVLTERERAEDGGTEANPG